MRSELRPALVMLILLTLVTGVAYPLLVTGIARVAFPAPGGGQPDPRGRPRGGLEPDRADLR